MSYELQELKMSEKYKLSYWVNNGSGWTLKEEIISYDRVKELRDDPLKICVPLTSIDDACIEEIK